MPLHVGISAEEIVVRAGDHPHRRAQAIDVVHDGMGHVRRVASLTRQVGRPGDGGRLVRDRQRPFLVHEQHAARGPGVLDDGAHEPLDEAAGVGLAGERPRGLEHGRGVAWPGLLAHDGGVRRRALAAPRAPPPIEGPDLHEATPLVVPEVRLSQAARRRLGLARALEVLPRQLRGDRGVLREAILARAGDGQVEPP
jgi:hypothetical protein